MASFLKSLGAAGEAYKMLQAIDQDGLGISEDDFIAFAQRIGLGEAGESAAKLAFQQVDTNGNGKIDLKEAYNAYQQITQLLNMSKNE